MIRKAVTPETLSASVEFDCPFQVFGDGTISNEPLAGVSAPEVLDEKIEEEGWEFVTGYSGQEGYRGPIMHNSEFLGGGMARGVLDRPGIYALVAAYWSQLEGDNSDLYDGAEGWALLHKVQHCAGINCGTKLTWGQGGVINYDSGERIESYHSDCFEAEFPSVECAEARRINLK